MLLPVLVATARCTLSSRTQSTTPSCNTRTSTPAPIARTSPPEPPASAPQSRPRRGDISASCKSSVPLNLKSALLLSEIQLTLLLYILYRRTQFLSQTECSQRLHPCSFTRTAQVRLPVAAMPPLFSVFLFLFCKLCFKPHLLIHKSKLKMLYMKVVQKNV